MIKGWLDAVAVYALERVNKGGQIAGQKLVAGRGSRTWKGKEDDVSTEVRRLSMSDGKRIGKADIYTEALLSPAQMETRIKPLVKKETWVRIEALIETKKGKPALAPLSDPRTAISTTAKDVFAGVAKPAVAEVPSFLL